MKNESVLEEYFFLQYHLGMKLDKIKELSDHDRKLMIELFCRKKKNDPS